MARLQIDMVRRVIKEVDHSFDMAYIIFNSKNKKCRIIMWRTLAGLRLKRPL